MIRGLYTGAAGMLNQLERYDTIANNLANIGTPGFKRQEAISSDFPAMLMYRIRDARDVRPTPIGRLGTGAFLAETVTRHDPGTLEDTGNPYDLAIGGAGYFAIETAAGIRYTRNGNFRVDGDGYLVTASGQFVLGADGAPLVVSAGWSPSDVRVVEIADADLIKEGDNLFRLRDGAAEPEVAVGAQVAGNRLETSNVNPVMAMVDMMAAMRAYEASQKVVQAMDDTLGKAVNEIARPS